MNVVCEYAALNAALHNIEKKKKSLVEGMSVTEKRKWHRCKMKLHGLNISFGPVTTFKWFRIH